MEVKNKQEIVKLLNLDSMIDQYQRESKPFKRQMVLHRLGKNQQCLITNQNKKIKGIWTIKKSTDFQKIRTKSSMEMLKSSNNFNNIGRKSMLPMKSSFKRATSYQTSIPSPMQSNFKVSHRLKCKSTKLFKPDSLIKQDEKYFTRGVYSSVGQLEEEYTNGQYEMKESEVNWKKIKNFKKDLVKRQKMHQLHYKSQMGTEQKKNGSLLKGRYKLQKIIGRGLSGQVYRGWDVLSERQVAIKIIDPKNVEYEFIKELQHPNLISYYNSFLENGKRYIVLEYLPKSLAEIARKKKFNQNQLKKVFKSIALGLMHLHSMSYAHRDIKLDNIVVIQDLSVVKFIDFGLCLDTTQSDCQEKQRFCGTVSYMAPEIVEGKCKQPKKADIWSLGVVLYTLSVGRNPFVGRQEKQTLNRISNSKTLFPTQMSKQLKTLLSAMLNKDPNKRPSIFEIVNDNWLAQ